jgi:hypothetical protein
MEAEKHGRHAHSSCMDAPCTEPAQADPHAGHGHEHHEGSHDEHGACHAAPTDD